MMTHNPNQTLVWAEIPVTDLKKSIDFYDAVFGYTLTIDESGPTPMSMFPMNDSNPTAGHLYVGKPAAAGTGSTVHLALPGLLEEGMARCTAAGGTIVSPAIEIPPGRFAYAQDIDGNSIGLFETKER